jgi:hypothetical protein
MLLLSKSLAYHQRLDAADTIRTGDRQMSAARPILALAFAVPTNFRPERLITRILESELIASGMFSVTYGKQQRGL